MRRHIAIGFTALFLFPSLALAASFGQVCLQLQPHNTDVIEVSVVGIASPQLNVGGSAFWHADNEEFVFYGINGGVQAQRPADNPSLILVKGHFSNTTEGSFGGHPNITIEGALGGLWRIEATGGPGEDFVNENQPLAVVSCDGVAPTVAATQERLLGMAAQRAVTSGTPAGAGQE